MDNNSTAQLVVVSVPLLVSRWQREQIDGKGRAVMKFFNGCVEIMTPLQLYSDTRPLHAVTCDILASNIRSMGNKSVPERFLMFVNDLSTAVSLLKVQAFPSRSQLLYLFDGDMFD